MFKLELVYLFTGTIEKDLGSFNSYREALDYAKSYLNTSDYDHKYFNVKKRKDCSIIDFGNMSSLCFKIIEEK